MANKLDSVIIIIMPKDEFTESELAAYPEFDTFGNLVHYVHADIGRLNGILTGGLKPRGGSPEENSHYPDVVSLSVHSGYFRFGSLERNKVIVTNNARRALEGYPYDPNKFHNYIILIDPKWVSNNIGDFQGVGDVFFNDEERGYYLQGILSELAVRRLKTTGSEVPFANEVQFIRGALPVVSFAGILIDEKDERAICAKDTLVSVIRSLRETGLEIPKLALYSASGAKSDIV